MKFYKVEKITDKEFVDYGAMSEDELKVLLRGYKYDAELDMYFSRKCHIAYSVTEC